MRPSSERDVKLAYEAGTDRIVAAACVVTISTGEIVEEIVVPGEARFPYLPGLLAFREVPILLDVLARLRPVDAVWPAIWVF